MRGAVLVLLLVACDARGLLAQRVDGQIRDAQSNATLSGVQMRLLNTQDQEVARVVSDGRGLFSLRAPEPGIYRIRASRVGYREGTSSAIDLTAGSELDVDVRLTADAVRLDPLTVTGIPRYERLQEQGFYERRERFGPDGLRMAVFLEQHDIERMNPGTLGDIFHHVPGVRTERGGVQMHGGCTPAIVIDGFLAQPGVGRLSRRYGNRLPPGSRREISTPRALVGVEVYTGLAIPDRYLIDADGCGVIMYWTK